MRSLVKRTVSISNTVGININYVASRAFFTVPFQRDDKFVGRESVMAEVDRRYQKAASQNHLRIALVGMGGVG